MKNTIRTTICRPSEGRQESQKQGQHPNLQLRPACKQTVRDKEDDDVQALKVTSSSTRTADVASS